MQRNSTTSRHHPTKPRPAHPCDSGLALPAHARDPNVPWCYPVRHTGAPSTPNSPTCIAGSRSENAQPLHQPGSGCDSCLLPAAAETRVTFQDRHPKPKPHSQPQQLALGHRGGGTAHAPCAPTHLCKPSWICVNKIAAIKGPRQSWMPGNRHGRDDPTLPRFTTPARQPREL